MASELNEPEWAPAISRASGKAEEGSKRAEQIQFMDLLSYIYLRHGFPEKAAVLLAARDVLEPDHPQTLLALALAQVRAGKAERALATLERLALTGRVDASFHLVRAQAFQVLGQADQAATAMRAHVTARASQPVSDNKKKVY